MIVNATFSEFTVSTTSKNEKDFHYFWINYNRKLYSICLNILIYPTLHNRYWTCLQVPEIGQIRTVIVERGPTGLDMQTVLDGQWLRVAEVAPRGVAENAGICIGDVLLSAMCDDAGMMLPD